MKTDKDHKETFYRKYRLLKDTPTAKRLTLFQWDLWRELYTSHLQVSGPDPEEITFKREEVEGNIDWFFPCGQPTPFYAPFPKDFAERHFYFGELRHNKMCRFCTIARDVLDSDEYKKIVTEIFSAMYVKVVERRSR